MKEVLRRCLTQLSEFKNRLRQFQQFFNNLRDEVDNLCKNAIGDLKMSGEDLDDAPTQRVQCLGVSNLSTYMTASA